MMTHARQPTTRRGERRHIMASLRALFAGGSLALALSGPATVSADPGGSPYINAAGQTVAAVATQMHEAVTPGVGEQAVTLLVPAVQKVREAALKIPGVDRES